MCDQASPHYNLTYYTTYVPCGRGSFITFMLFLITIRHVCFLFVDLIDTTASVRDPSCLLCFHFMFGFLFCFAARSRAEVRISLPSLSSFFPILFTHLFLDSCAAEQALINGSYPCVTTLDLDFNMIMIFSNSLSPDVQLITCRCN